MKSARWFILSLLVIVAALALAPVSQAATGKFVSRSVAAEAETTWSPGALYCIMSDKEGGREEALPKYVTDVAEDGTSYWVWETGGRGVILPSTGEAIAGCWYSGEEFSLTVNVKDDAEHIVSVFLFDFDSYGPRQAEVTMVDAKTDKELDKQVVEEFIKPVTLTYSYQGSVKFIVKNLAEGKNVVVSALFFK